MFHIIHNKPDLPEQGKKRCKDIKSGQICDALKWPLLCTNSLKLPHQYNTECEHTALLYLLFCHNMYHAAHRARILHSKDRNQWRSSSSRDENSHSHPGVVEIPVKIQWQSNYMNSITHRIASTILCYLYYKLLVLKTANIRLHIRLTPSSILQGSPLHERESKYVHVDRLVTLKMRFDS